MIPLPTKIEEFRKKLRKKSAASHNALTERKTSENEDTSELYGPCHRALQWYVKCLIPFPASASIVLGTAAL